jgi:hypothetical protein
MQIDSRSSSGGRFAAERLVKLNRTEKTFDRALQALSNDIEDN